MEGSRERGLRESIKKRQSLLSRFLRILHSSEQGHTPAWTQPAQNKTKGISVHSSTKHTSVSTTGFQISDLEPEVVAFSIKRLLYKCYGTAAFMFNNDSS